VRDNYPNANVTLNMAREIKERFGFVGDTGERVIVTLPTDGRPIDFDLTEPLKSACRSIVTPLVQGLRDVVARLDPEFRQSILNNIILSGGGSQLKGLDRVIEDTLREQGGGRVRKAYDAMFAAASGAHKLALGMPADDWKKVRRPSRTKVPAAQPLKVVPEPVVVKQFATMAQVVADQSAKKAA
jgi:rod shape-determining protein MreB